MFLKYTVNTTVNKYMSNKSTINQLVVSEPTANKLKVIVPTVAERFLLIMDCDFSYSSVGFFRFVKNHSISLVCLPLYIIKLLYYQDVKMFKSLSNVYVWNWKGGSQQEMQISIKKTF